MAKININYSPNFNISRRPKKNINFVIIHYTGMKNELSVVKKFCDFKSKVSSHYLIKKNGEVINFVPDLYEAWHAGKSRWKKLKSLNKYSIGIEIHNRGHEFKYEKFPSKQIASLKYLLKKLIKKYRIHTKNILGHSDIAPDRKKDPGEKFPWNKLGKNNLAHWHKLNEKKIIKYRNVKLNKSDEKKFLKNIYLIGYNRVKELDPISNKKVLYTAFQRRFRQSLINGNSDLECLLISKNLLKQ